MRELKDLRTPIIIIRRSPIILVFILFLLELSFLVLFVLFRLPAYLFQDIKDTLFNVNTWVLGGLIITKLIATVYFVLNWSNEYYEVYSDEIRHCRGVMYSRESRFMCHNTQSITISQDFLGKIFGFGTVSIYNPALDRKIRLAQINNPKQKAEMIKQIQSPSGNGSAPRAARATFMMKQE